MKPRNGIDRETILRRNWAGLMENIQSGPNVAESLVEGSSSTTVPGHTLEVSNILPLNVMPSRKRTSKLWRCRKAPPSGKETSF